MPTQYDFTKIKEIVSYLTKAEDKVSHVKVGDMREIVGILSDMLVSDVSCQVLEALIKNGKRRAK